MFAFYFRNENHWLLKTMEAQFSLKTETKLVSDYLNQLRSGWPWPFS